MAGYSISLGGRPVVELRMGLPRVGAWWAQLALADNEDAPQGKLELSLNGFNFSGTVRRSDISYGTPTALLVGGAAGLNVRLAARSYRQQSLRLILNDILGAAGEVVSSDSDAGVLSTIIPSWSTANRLGGEGLATLLEYVPRTAWRFRQDGTLWVGAETWPALDVEDLELLDDDALARTLLFFAPQPSVLPGQSYSGRHIGYVEHRLVEGSLRTELTFVGHA